MFRFRAEERRNKRSKYQDAENFPKQDIVKQEVQKIKELNSSKAVYEVEYASLSKRKPAEKQ